MISCIIAISQERGREKVHCLQADKQFILQVDTINFGGKCNICTYIIVRSRFIILTFTDYFNPCKNV